MLLPNVPMKTLGGQVFWETVESKNGWELQQHTFSEHYRILDPQKIRLAWSYDLYVIQSTFRKFTRYNLVE